MSENASRHRPQPPAELLASQPRHFVRPRARNWTKLLTRLEVLEDTLANLSPGAQQNDLLWGERCQHLQALRGFYASRPQSPDVVRKIEAIETLERRIQAIDPNTADLETMQEISGCHIAVYLEALRDNIRLAGADGPAGADRLPTPSSWK
jgi:hypothetical protein